MNTLYYGDNLDVLRKYIKDESVDLIYLDPPFNSNQSYNILFQEKNGTKSSAQIQAFEDTWHWDLIAEETWTEIVEESLNSKLADLMIAMQKFLGRNDMMAYLVMMAIRLQELHRVLKSTGSIYLHCDPTASHYLKLVMDAVFGVKNFLNEITWKRTTAHNDPGRYGNNVDILLFYAKKDGRTWNSIYRAHDPKYIARFRFSDPNGRRWTDDNLTAKGLAGGGYEYEYQGIRSLWRCPPETMKKLDAEGRLHFTKKGGIRLKRYLDENKGIPLQALWEDIPPINSQARERLGLPNSETRGPA